MWAAVSQTNTLTTKVLPARRVTPYLQILVHAHNVIVLASVAQAARAPTVPLAPQGTTTTADLASLVTQVAPSATPEALLIVRLVHLARFLTQLVLVLRAQPQWPVLETSSSTIRHQPAWRATRFPPIRAPAKVATPAAQHAPVQAPQAARAALLVGTWRPTTRAHPVRRHQPAPLASTLMTRAQVVRKETHCRKIQARVNLAQSVLRRLAMKTQHVGPQAMRLVVPAPPPTTIAVDRAPRAQQTVLLRTGLRLLLVAALPTQLAVIVLVASSMTAAHVQAVPLVQARTVNRRLRAMHQMMPSVATVLEMPTTVAARAPHAPRARPRTAKRPLRATHRMTRSAATALAVRTTAVARAQLAHLALA